MSRLLPMFFLLLLLAGIAVAADRIEPPKNCQRCGMDRAACATSRMVIVYANGSSDGLCSLNCAVEQMKKYPNKQVKSIQVADFTTRKLMDATTASWVVGGKYPGVMTALPKWAFAAQEDARKFVQENGGRLTGFDEALKLALKEHE